jgi:hypothetical protein
MWVGTSNLWLHTENKPFKLPGSALKVSVGGGWLEREHSDRLWLEHSLGQVEPQAQIEQEPRLHA